MGLGYAKGVRKRSPEALVVSPQQDGLFRPAEDLALRVPPLDRRELTLLARIGALNKLDGIAHRREALWQKGGRKLLAVGSLEEPTLMARAEMRGATSADDC
jgi:error-prone DNA polymerase